MRVAVCMSGLTRAVEHSIPLLREHLIKPYDADLFVHHWNDISIGGMSKRFLSGRTSNSPSTESFFRDNGAVDVVSESFEDLKWDFANVHAPETRRMTTAPMYYGIYRANKLKSKHEDNLGKKYDIVIRTRPDNFYSESLPDDEVTDAMNNPVIYVRGAVHDWGSKTPRNNFLYECGDDIPFVADNFAFGSSESMNVYADTYKNILNFKEHCKNQGPDMEGPIPASEICLGYQLRSQGIEYKRSKIRYKQLVDWTDQHFTAESWYDGPHGDGMIGKRFG
jgi:hypothetical protein